MLAACVGYVVEMETEWLEARGWDQMCSCSRNVGCCGDFGTGWMRWEGECKASPFSSFVWRGEGMALVGGMKCYEFRFFVSTHFVGFGGWMRCDNMHVTCHRDCTTSHGRTRCNVCTASYGRMRCDKMNVVSRKDWRQMRCNAGCMSQKLWLQMRWGVMRCTLQTVRLRQLDWVWSVMSFQPSYWNFVLTTGRNRGKLIHCA